MWLLYTLFEEQAKHNTLCTGFCNEYYCQALDFSSLTFIIFLFFHLIKLKNQEIDL